MGFFGKNKRIFFQGEFFCFCFKLELESTLGYWHFLKLTWIFFCWSFTVNIFTFLFFLLYINVKIKFSREIYCFNTLGNAFSRILKDYKRKIFFRKTLIINLFCIPGPNLLKMMQFLKAYNGRLKSVWGEFYLYKKVLLKLMKT